MPLTRRSKVKEAMRYPHGHDLLLCMARQTGRGESWLHSPLVANMPLFKLDRTAGPGFADALLCLTTCDPEPAAAAPEPRAWWKESVIYQIYPPSFMDSDHDGVGDLAGVTQRLPYLENLGVDALWLWPVLAEGAGGRGVRDYKELHSDLGTTEDFEYLCTQAHARGMKVIMGLDVGCTSDEHPWFKETLGGRRDGYYVLKPGAPETPPNNWTRVGAPAWTWYPELKSWGLHLCSRRQMDLNWDNPAVREEIQGVLRFWQEKGADGFYLGPVSLLSKASWDDGLPAAAVQGLVGYEKFAYGPKLHRYLQDLRAAVPEPGFLAGEARGAGPEMAKLFTGPGRAELNMVLDNSHLSPRHRARGEEGQLELAALKDYYLRWMNHYGDAGWMALFLETPDTPRIVSRLGASGLYRSVLAKLLATLLLTLRGTPIIYQGEELGLPNTRFGSARELRAPGSLRLYTELKDKLGEAEALQRVLKGAPDHARTPMPWSGGEKAGFTGAMPWMRPGDGTDYLNAAAQMDDDASVWNHHRRLIARRRASPALVYGSFNPVFVKNKRVFCYFRILDGEKWYVEMNLTEREVGRPGRILRSQKLELSNYDNPSRTLRPYEANLYRCE